VLRYVAEYRGQWVALVVFSSPAFPIKLRDQWLHWSPHQVKERRHLIAQNARFLVLAAPGKWPNLASRVLRLACERLPRDWQAHFGYPVQVVETFVDPLRFRGPCYKAAGWQQLGPTRGLERDWQDFYTDTRHPKQLWVRPLGEGALEQVRAAELPPALADPQGPLPPACPVATAQLGSLWECFRKPMTDPRKPKGVRHKLAGFLTLVALAVAAGCKGPHAIAEFAQSLNHAQRGRLRCRPRPSRPREDDVPAERTFRRLLKQVDSEPLKDVLVDWMEAEDWAPLQVVPVHGKVVKNAQPAPARSLAQPAEAACAEPGEVPAELQKPKADKALMLVNFQTTEQRLVDQVAVPPGYQRRGGGGRPLARDGFGGGLCDRRCRSHHQSQRPPTHSRQRRRVLPVLKGQPAFGAGQSRATAARRTSPLRPAHGTKITDELRTANSGASPLTPRRSA